MKAVYLTVICALMIMAGPVRAPVINTSNNQLSPGGNEREPRYPFSRFESLCPHP
jgi:hypothetical protein